MTKFIAVVAYDQKYGIAKDGSVPWSLPSDTWLYQQLVSGAVVVHSRKVFAQQPNKKLLLKRQIILTGKERMEQETAHSLENLLEATKDEPLVYVCGGQDVYQTLLPYISTVIATEIAQNFNCDRFFFTEHKNWHKKEIATLNTSPDQPSATLVVYNR